jgi:hypothetical protein
MNRSISFFEVLGGRLVQRAQDLLVQEHSPGRREQQLVAPAVFDELLDAHLPVLDRALDVVLRGEPLRSRVELLRARRAEVGV